MPTNLEALGERALAVTAEGVDRENWHAASRAVIAHAIASRDVLHPTGHKVTCRVGDDVWTERVVGWSQESGNPYTVNLFEGTAEEFDPRTADDSLVWTSDHTLDGEPMTTARAEAMLRAKAGEVPA